MRIRVGIVDTGRIRALNQPHLNLAEPHPGPFVERPVGHNAVRYAGRNGDSGLLDRGARRAATMVDLGEELQIPDAGRAGHRYLGVGVHGERDHAVHIRRSQSGVVKCGQHRLGGKPKLTSAGVLGKVSRANPGDRGLTR